MIRALIFDMDETLLDRQGSLRRFAASPHTAHPDTLGRLPVEQFVERFIELDNNGARWKDEVYRPNSFWPNSFWPDCLFADAECTDLRQLPAILRGFEASP